ncbi:hypothetical protein E3O60_03795 [Cryobacterium sp. TMB1-7]|nr:hypothetical protein E3O60_03795 [Cryobacterium sp. TMB1-7]TFC67129.1 hypothetical protein E3T21_16705 [Cryobacterium sp. TMB3-15]TFC73358.1 hypothetical protein E3T22_17350 [Cryobacterium sp. TMB3-10]
MPNFMPPNCAFCLATTSWRMVVPEVAGDATGSTGSGAVGRESWGAVGRWSLGAVGRWSLGVMGRGSLGADVMMFSSEGWCGVRWEILSGIRLTCSAASKTVRTPHLSCSSVKKSHSGLVSRCDSGRHPDHAVRCSTATRLHCRPTSRAPLSRPG